MPPGLLRAEREEASGSDRHYVKIEERGQHSDRRRDGTAVTALEKERSRRTGPTHGGSASCEDCSQNQRRGDAGTGDQSDQSTAGLNEGPDAAPPRHNPSVDGQIQEQDEREQEGGHGEGDGPLCFP